MHDAPEYHSSSSSSSSGSGSHDSGRQHQHQHHHRHHQHQHQHHHHCARTSGTAHLGSKKMTASSMESIGQMLHQLEKRLEEQNNAPNIMIAPSSGGGAELGPVSGVVGAGVGRTPRPHLPAMDGTPNRSSMRLPVMSTPNHNAPETEMQKKLKLIRKQSGILTIKGQKYHSKISDLERVSDLGNGTSGNVVKMRHKPTGTIIAVKQMRGTGNKEENNRILMDLDVILNSHDCQYIVHCLGYFVNGQDVWICMELMSMCFDKLLKLSKQPVPERILGKVTVATVKALSYLKEKHNVIHRDVKPSNILIDERGNIKLCDFGISGRLVDSKANTRSAGCAAYMAPERIDPRKPEYDIRADVWSLGITLVELATGRSPYEGCNIDFEVLTKILDNEPPSLPYGDGFNFSDEFRDFVEKCLTKNYLDRPKYPALKQQPFFRYYDEVEVNVAQWFETVVETAGIETHRTHLPMTLRGDATTTNKHKSAITHIATTVTANANTTATVNTTTATTTATATAMTINAKSTQIPSYQNAQQLQQQQAALNRYKRDDYLTHPNQHQYHQQQHPPSQLPQPIISYYNNTANDHLQGERGGGVGGNGSGGGGGGVGYGVGIGIVSGSASAHTSPQSPPNLQPKDDAAQIVSEMNKLYRKSPFLQRKYSNGAAFKYSADSPKKESMFSSIGQSIIRNLTTSPFSQKKHTTPQPHQIDPLWRMPTVPDAAGNNAFDICDATSTKTLIASPALARKRFPATTITAADAKQQQPSLIPINRNETNPQRVQGNHSPIVLQRFYHQQNQLREKEFERQQYQPYARHSPESTNPFLSSYQPTATQLHYNHYQLPHQQQAHNTLAASSSHSTSSQSSTQSSSSQIAVSELQQQRAALHSPPTTTTGTAGTAITAGFGTSVGQLQYQPLPQQYLPLHSTVRNSRSPPTSPEQLSDGGGGTGGLSGGTGSKLGKMYARRQLQTTSVMNSTTTGLEGGVGVSHGASKENNFKDEHGWFNSFAGAMKRQFASYVKLQLNSSANVAAPAVTAPSNNGSTEAPAITPAPSGKSALPYYRTLSAGSSSNTSNSTSPIEAPPKGNGIGRPEDFYELNNGGSGNSSSFLRRYAAAGASGMTVGTAGGNAQLLSGLDRRHRSPDPPPRYNRGQSPLLLRKNLLELGGQPPGSPLLNRRYVTASPPLPPPRRGSESVPGSPQHFRTRIHYTPEPQRRIYRTIDQ